MKNLIFLLVFFGFSTVFGQNEELFEEAVSAYNEEEYATAVEKYERILDNGEASVALYYNLGNAHYRMGNVAPSIYYYEKALQLDPDDPDVLNNLRFAREMTVDEIAPVEETGLEKRINELISTFSYNTWAKIAIGFSLLFVILFLAYYFSGDSLKKRLLFFGALLSLLLVSGSVFFAFEQEQIQRESLFAIVFSEEAQVRNEPNPRGQTTFVLHEGTKAKVLEDFQDWVKIELADGQQGWIEIENIKKI